MQPPQCITNLYSDRSSGNSPPEVNEQFTSAPANFLIQFGILKVPISLHCLWWVQPSEIRTLSPDFNFERVAAPFTRGSRLPLYLANKIENDVRVISSGVSFDTLAKACESVITILGLSLSLSKVAVSSVS